LVECDFNGPQSLVLLGFIDLTMLQFGPQLLFLGDQLVDLIENVLVLRHGSSLPDYGVCGEYETRDRIS
jgi:hypothetical protein